jgi:hypothetical protein
MPPVPPPDPATRPRRRRTGAPSTNGEIGAAADPGAPSANGATGRDAAGRFARGNAGGPGNPFARRVAALRRAVLDTVTAEDVQAVVRKLLQEALRGDVPACKVLLAYAIGRPAEAVDPDTVDLHEWRMYRDSIARTEDLTGMLATVPPQVACLLARAVLPHLGDAFARTFLEQAELQTLGPPDDADNDPAL